MTLRDEDKWKHIVEVNDDDYGKATVDYAEAWANLMEKEMTKGKKLEEVANQTSKDADTEGITGFMYGCAVGILSQVWVYGEQLRQWHNLDTQIKDEGEKANEKGTVLNPALLTVEVKE